MDHCPLSACDKTVRLRQYLRLAQPPERSQTNHRDRADSHRPQAGRELNVRYVLEGSVQRNGNRLRVNVQLVDAQTANHLWAERFAKAVADMFDMPDEILSRLANALNAQLIKAEARRAERSLNPDAMD